MTHKKTAVYPGSFDPVTYGHIDIIRRAAKIFDKVIVAVARSDSKRPLFTLEERIDMLKEATKGMPNVVVEGFGGLVVEYVKKTGSDVMVRGIRMISDFEYEFQMALTNRKFAGEVETIFLMPSEAYSYISSKLIKEAAGLGADVREFVPKHVALLLKKKLSEA